jgi:hypothetical protein
LIDHSPITSFQIVNPTLTIYRLKASVSTHSFLSSDHQSTA